MFAAEVLAYAAGGVLVLWGVAHIAPTRSVASSFGSLSVDNRRVLVWSGSPKASPTSSWACWSSSLRRLRGPSAAGSAVVYRAAAAFLALLVVWTAVTGARTPVIWYRICLGVLTAAAALLVAASLA
jgi:hypothetical protein